MQKVIKLIALKQALSYIEKKADETIQEYYDRLLEIASELLNDKSSSVYNDSSFDPNSIIM